MKQKGHLQQDGLCFHLPAHKHSRSITIIQETTGWQGKRSVNCVWLAADVTQISP